MAAFGKLLKAKQGFLTSVYVTLIVELLITFAIVYQFRNHPALSKATKQSFWVYLLLSLGLILLLTLVQMPIWLKLLLFTAFAVVTGGLLHNATYKLPTALIDKALWGAIGVFAAMTIVAFVLAAAGVDLGFMGLIMLGALIGLLVASLIIILTGNARGEDNKLTPLYKTVLVIGLMIFGIYIMYSTNIMLQKDYGFDFVSAAIDLYLGFINVFTKLLVLESD
jgi:FtsH-binding integral membrane protein